MARFQRQSFLTPQVAQTQDLSSLAQRLGAVKQVSSSVFDVVAPIAGERARRLGAEQAEQEFDEEGRPIAPALRSGITAAGRGFNEASIKAYQGALSNDILEGVERIKAESFTEAEFSKKVGEFKAGVMTDVPPQFQGQFLTLFDNIATRGRIELQGVDVERANQENKVLAQQGLTGFSRQATKAAFNGDLETLEFARDSFIDLLDNPRFTPSEIAESILELDKELDEQQVLGTVDSLYTDDPRKAFIAISAFSNNKDLDIAPDEQKRITALAYQGVMNRTKISEQTEKIEDDDNEARIKANEEDLSVKAYSDELSEVEFLQSIRDRDIDPEAADRIRKRMNNVSAVKDNANVLLDIERDFYDLTTEEIELRIDNGVEDGDLTSSTASRLQRNLITRDKATEDEQTTITRNLLRGFLTEQSALSSVFDKGKERRLASGLAQYNERTAAGEEPNTVFLDILNQSSEQNELILRTLPSLRFGSPENLDDSETQVTNAFNSQEITREEANRQLELIKTMRGLKLRFTKK